jgi:hypothetical protein
MLRTLSSRLSPPALARVQLFTSSRALTSIPRTRQFVINRFQNQMRSLSTKTALRATAAVSASSPSSSSSSSSSSTSASSSSSSSSPAPVPESVGDLVQRYGGWGPLVGLGGALAVSKEWLILNEELLLATNFTVFVLVIWLGLGDSITKAVEDHQSSIQKQTDEVCDFEVDIYKSMIESHQSNIATLDVLKGLKSEYSSLVAAAVKAKDLKARQAARDAVVSRLTSLKTKEETELSSYLDEVYDRTTGYVKRSFQQLSASEKNLLVDHAISVVGGSAQPLESTKDPLKKLYQSYFDGRLYEKEIEADRQAKLRK